MNAYGNGSTNRPASAPGIRALLAASFDDEQVPASVMLARAMIFAQSAKSNARETLLMLESVSALAAESGLVAVYTQRGPRARRAP